MHNIDNKKTFRCFLQTIISYPSNLSKTKSLKIHLKREHLVEIVLAIGRRLNRRFSKAIECLPYRMTVCEDIDLTT